MREEQSNPHRNHAASDGWGRAEGSTAVPESAALGDSCNQ
jgi:hypothetical protein